jgi:hypothetical protein
MSWDGEGASTPRAPRPHRLLSRLTVFMLGIAIGAGAGAFVTAGYLMTHSPTVGASASAAVIVGAPTSAIKAPAVASAATPAKTPVAGPRAGPAAFYPSVSPPLAVGRPLVVGVFGDSLGDGLWAGLYHQLRADKRFQVVKFSQPSTGLTRYDYVDVQKNTADQLAGKQIDIAVILFGTNDQQGVISGGVHPFGSPEWRAVYDQRIENLVGLLRQKGAAVYWVGLPRMERDGFDRGASLINGIYADEARALNIPFIPTAPLTQDPDGDYAAYLPVSAGGRPVLLRAKDGIHMTMEGYLRIAAPVAERLRTDLAAAEAAHGPALAQQAPAQPGAPAGPPPPGPSPAPAAMTPVSARGAPAGIDR